MAAARLIHFGEDECYRTPIMRGAGYNVEQCESIPDLQQALKSPETTDLICISESYHRPREDALAISRALSKAPVVLFRSTMHRYIADRFDLEIDTLAEPEVWLLQLDGLIEESRKNGDPSRQTTTASQKLREESAAARKQPRAFRAPSAEPKREEEA